MDMSSGKEASELLQAQAHVWNYIFNFINSMSLNCAIQLGIPDIIQNHGQPMTLSQLVTALPIHPSKAHGVHRLMRILVHCGFFSQQKVGDNDQEEGYVPTHVSRLLLKDHPLSVTPFLLAMLDPSFTKPWHYVSTWFQNEDLTPFDTAHGRSFYDYWGQEPKLTDFFSESMASDARLVASVLVSKYKGVFEGLESLVDVGGGTGTVAKAIANAFPQLECAVLDLPHVIADLQGTNNMKYVEGDMFEAIPCADATLLKWILHDWSDEECVKILKGCKKAITSKDKGGKVIIIDMVMENNLKGDEKSKETQLFFDMLLMVLLPGKQRNKKEWEKLFSDAGFSEYKITPMGLRSLIEVFP